tara:strand:+ start:118 stop:372 length:255 start_codon:yes stop_codon:yes gene_type:complete
MSWLEENIQVSSWSAGMLNVPGSTFTQATELVEEWYEPATEITNVTLFMTPLNHTEQFSMTGKMDFSGLVMTDTEETTNKWKEA